MKDEIHAVDDVVLIVHREIPGYSGYNDGNTRDKSDNELRHYLIKKLDFIFAQFNKKQDQLLSIGGDEYQEMVNNISQSMRAIAQSLKNPCYCSNQGKIANNKLSQQEIEQLHGYDVQLMEHLQILEDEITHLPDQFSEHELPDLLAHVYDLIDGFNQSLTEREFIFLGQEDEI